MFEKCMKSDECNVKVYCTVDDEGLKIWKY